MLTHKIMAIIIGIDIDPFDCWPFNQAEISDTRPYLIIKLHQYPCNIRLIRAENMLDENY